MTVKLDPGNDAEGFPWQVQFPAGYVITQSSIGRIVLAPDVAASSTTTYVPRTISRRRFFLPPRRRDTVTWTPIVAVVTVTATYVPPVAQTRRARGLLRRHVQPSVPLTQAAAVVTVTVPAIARPTRRLQAARRGRIAQTVTVTVSYVPQIARPTRRRPAIRRGQVTQTTIAAVVAVVVPPYVPPTSRRNPRGYTRRGRTVSTPLTQTATVVVTATPQITGGRRLRAFRLVRRGTTVQTPITVTVTVPAITRPTRRHYGIRRGRAVSTAVAQVVVVIPPYIAPTTSRRRFAWGRRRHQQPVTPLTQIIVNDTTIPGPVIVWQEPNTLTGRDPAIYVFMEPLVQRSRESATNNTADAKVLTAREPNAWRT